MTRGMNCLLADYCLCVGCWCDVISFSNRLDGILMGKGGIMGRAGKVTIQIKGDTEP